MVFFAFVGATRTDPFIDFGEPELPQSPDLVRGQALALSPAVDGVFHDPQMLGDLLGGDPWFSVYNISARRTASKSS